MVVINMLLFELSEEIYEQAQKWPSLKAGITWCRGDVCGFDSILTSMLYRSRDVHRHVWGKIIDGSGGTVISLVVSTPVVV